MSPTAPTSTPNASFASFADLGVPSWLVAALDRRGIDTPFPVQTATIPDGLAGRDLCGRAPTGSGKTIAFGLPLMARIGEAQPRRPRGLVLVPTRELAAQVRDELAALAGRRRSVEAVYGGVGFDRQVRALRQGVDVIVACPGRLADLVNQGQVRLDAVEIAVIDEADRLADMGFLPEVRRLLDRCPSDRQTLLFSATLDGDVDVFVKRYQREPARYELAIDDDDVGRAVHHFWTVERPDRIATAAQVIDRVGPTVVFCRTKRGADRVARQLATHGVTAAAIHGDRSQGQRERALQSFHRGQVAALVATDVAARGIHVDDVAAVIHFDPPADEKDYTHRSGRTARAGRTGVVVTFVPRELRDAVHTLQRKLGVVTRIEKVALEAVGAAGRHVPKRRPQQARRADGPTAKGQKRKPRRSHDGHRTGGTSAGTGGNANGNAVGGERRRGSGASRRKAKRTTKARSQQR